MLLEWNSNCLSTRERCIVPESKSYLTLFLSELVGASAWQSLLQAFQRFCTDDAPPRRRQCPGWHGCKKILGCFMHIRMCSAWHTAHGKIGTDHGGLSTLKASQGISWATTHGSLFIRFTISQPRSIETPHPLTKAYLSFGLITLM